MQWVLRIWEFSRYVWRDNGGYRIDPETAWELALIKHPLQRKDER